MKENNVLDFPFVEHLPVRKAAVVESVFDRIAGLLAMSEEHGVLLPVAVAAKALNVSRTRIDVLIVDGKLQRVDIYDHVFVSSKSVERHAKSSRLPGRPRSQTVST